MTPHVTLVALDPPPTSIRLEVIAEAAAALKAAIPEEQHGIVDLLAGYALEGIALYERVGEAAAMIVQLLGKPE